MLELKTKGRVHKICSCVQLDGVQWSGTEYNDLETILKSKF